MVLATALMVMSHLMFLFGFSTGRSEEAVFAGGIVGIALGLVPGVFVVAAFVSRHPRALRSTLLATLLWMLVAIPIGLVNLPVGLVGGFGVGGAVAFRLDPVHSLRLRLLAVGACVAYTLVLQLVSPVAGLVGGAPLPFVAIGLVDSLQERAAAESDRR